MPDHPKARAVAEQLLAACNGHPNAAIPWPHRLLHDASDCITALLAERDGVESRLAQLEGANAALRESHSQQVRAVGYWVEQVAKLEGALHPGPHGLYPVTRGTDDTWHPYDNGTEPRGEVEWCIAANRYESVTGRKLP